MQILWLIKRTKDDAKIVIKSISYCICVSDVTIYYVNTDRVYQHLVHVILVMSPNASIAPSKHFCSESKQVWIEYIDFCVGQSYKRRRWSLN